MGSGLVWVRQHGDCLMGSSPLDYIFTWKTAKNAVLSWTNNCWHSTKQCCFAGGYLSIFCLVDFKFSAWNNLGMRGNFVDYNAFCDALELHVVHENIQHESPTRKTKVEEYETTVFYHTSRISKQCMEMPWINKYNKLIKHTNASRTVLSRRGKFPLIREMNADIDSICWSRIPGHAAVKYSFHCGTWSTD